LELVKREYAERIYIPENLKPYATGKKMVYFDIETLGLNPQLYPVILIGMSYEENGKYIIEQFFAESVDEEEDILQEFKKRLEGFDTIVSYNGKNFDVPYINRRMERYNMDYSIKLEHFDVICHVRPNKKLLGLESCSLKSVERYLKLNREDTIDGEESIRLYKKYSKTGDETIKDKIMLHNFEDVYNLPGILKIFEKISFAENNNIDSITSKQKAFLSSLLDRKNLRLSINIDSLSKIQASKLIDFMLNGTTCEYRSYIEN
jgi:predicted RecB family nuclease